MQWQPGALTIEISDRGPERAASPRPTCTAWSECERVRIHGGNLAAGNAVDGGFAVRALLPIEAP